MTQLNAKRRPIKRVETIFNLLYLSTVLVSAAALFHGTAKGSQRWLFGLMALVLGAGDTFHLVPRLGAMWDTRPTDYTVPLGVGKLIASITMTIFYILLWHVGLMRYPDVVPAYWSPIMYALAGLRIALCLLPQNRWTAQSPPRHWAIGRNIPFFALGIVVTALFATGSPAWSGGMAYLWVMILISFACYMPVVLFAGRYPKLGMLMLPKSCAYAAMVLVGFSLPGV